MTSIKSEGEGTYLNDNTEKPLSKPFLYFVSYHWASSEKDLAIYPDQKMKV